MTCENKEHPVYGGKCKASAIWLVSVGRRITDRQASCGTCLAFTCAAMHNAEDRPEAKLTLEALT